jgi:hypothetical protein
MKFRVTSITAPEVGAWINDAVIGLQNRLSPTLDSKDYGGDIGQFVVSFVSVDSDRLENERYCIANNRSSRYKDILTGKMVKFVGIAVPVDPEIFMGLSDEALMPFLEGALLRELEDPSYALPKIFQRLAVFKDIRLSFSSK